MPSVTDMHGIHMWSEIGVIFLLFALGLEFSFKKILKMGAAPIIAALAIIFAMMYVGAFTGHLFGWKEMDCIYLGGMLAMSSTTIIFKAFDDMGLRNERFAGLVLSVLIIEDILAIVLMVMLSTLAVSSRALRCSSPYCNSRSSSCFGSWWAYTLFRYSCVRQKSL